MESGPPDYNISTDESQRLLDQEIETNLAKIASHLADVESYRETVRALRSKRNQNAPISNLPPEIICKIFSFLQNDEEHDWRRWIYLAHVSRHWRDVVLAFPALWNNSPPLALPHWVNEILRRSPDKVPGFSLSANMDCHQSILGLKKILRHSSEIRSLSITNIQYKHRGILKYLQKFAPYLQALCMASPTGSGARDLDQFRIPDHILTAAVKLRRLELSDCRVYWNSYILPHITHLKLHDLSACGRPTYSEFMNALGKITALQHLDLKNALLFNEWTEEEHFPDHVTFSHLQSLTISCRISQAQQFFSGITYLPSAKINIRLSVNGSNYLPLKFSTIANARGLFDLDSCVIRTIVVDQGDSGLRLMLLTDTFNGPEDALTMYQNSADVRLLLEWEGVHSYTRLARIANQTLFDLFSSRFPLQEVSHVHLDASRIETETLVQTIGVLPAVSFVKVEGPIVKSFIDALHPIRTHQIQPGRLYFPNLQTICINDIVLESHSEDYLSIESLRDCLDKRRERGVAIRKMVLLECENLTEHDVAALRDIVGDVEWDGIDEDWDPRDEDSAEENDYSSSYDDSEGDNDYNSSISDSEDQDLSTSESDWVSELVLLDM
ncbi:hypothetical protein HYPSUDRAFT_62381 [Hypholoma sublateritium FD-334 SS-4]|uniref:F-box domain-containing protein n=1 Tax=Hypholoma sublateritium (strain FD-334 SS-4) TaxID=945553 RepID=A0A0D2PAR1_HYPSF|nr:hypothetical protein HYPSUDRAFT_62381 [Hypholoma sublateritium FD-334 SS-4]